MHRALFFPLPEPGHIYPTLNVAAYLVSSGWEVLYLTAPQFRPLVERIPGRLISLVPEDTGDREYSGQHIWSQVGLDSELGSRSRKITRLLVDAIIENDCSLILQDRKLSAPSDSSIDRALDGRRQVMLATSLPDWGESDIESASVPTLMFCPAEFEVPKFRRQLPNFHYVEPSVRQADNNSLSDWNLDPSRPLVLVAFGTQSIRDRSVQEKFRMIRELAEWRPEFDFIMATRGLERCPSQDSETVPSNLVMCREMPQSSLLQRTRVFITHGGLGGIKEAILAGVPMVVLPGMFDQPYNAMRVRYHGLGAAIFEEKLSVGALDAALSEVTSGRYDSNVRSMQMIFQALEAVRPSTKLLDMWMLENH